MSREYGYGEDQAHEPMVWDRVEWRQGDGRYVFEVARGGLLATLSSPHGAKLTLPMVAWEGLLDALAAARKTKARTERSLPSRTGARWSESEAQELAKAFKAGGSIAQLARVHNRTQFALEAQLERQGLWDRAERRPTARVVGDHPPPGTISAPTAQLAIPPALRSGPPGRRLSQTGARTQSPSHRLARWMCISDCPRGLSPAASIGMFPRHRSQVLPRLPATGSKAPAAASARKDEGAVALSSRARRQARGAKRDLRGERRIGFATSCEWLLPISRQFPSARIGIKFGHGKGGRQ